MEGDVITLQDIFLFDFGMGVDEHGRFRGHLKATGVRPEVRREARRPGHPPRPGGLPARGVRPPGARGSDEVLSDRILRTRAWHRVRRRSAGAARRRAGPRRAAAQERRLPDRVVLRDVDAKDPDAVKLAVSSRRRPRLAASTPRSPRTAQDVDVTVGAARPTRGSPTTSSSSSTRRRRTDTNALLTDATKSVRDVVVQRAPAGDAGRRSSRRAPPRRLAPGPHHRRRPPREAVDDLTPDRATAAVYAGVRPGGRPHRVPTRHRSAPSCSSPTASATRAPVASIAPRRPHRGRRRAARRRPRGRRLRRGRRSAASPRTAAAACRSSPRPARSPAPSLRSRARARPSWPSAPTPPATSVGVQELTVTVGDAATDGSYVVRRRASSAPSRLQPRPGVEPTGPELPPQRRSAG